MTLGDSLENQLLAFAHSDRAGLNNDEAQASKRPLKPTFKEVLVALQGLQTIG